MNICAPCTNEALMHTLFFVTYIYVSEACMQEAINPKKNYFMQVLLFNFCEETKICEVN